MPSRPHITVCICTYQRPALLLRLLEKLREQQTTADLRLPTSDLRAPVPSDLRPPPSDLCAPTPSDLRPPTSDFRVSIVVADNDAAESARQTVESFAATAPFPVEYCVEPRKNIAHVRNLVVSRAQGDFLAFIDDDEFPVEDWLLRLLQTAETHRAAGVLGPVRPHFETPPPAWLVRGRFCERPEHPTGMVLDWTGARTGNVLIRRSIIDGLDQPFDPAFGTGGEDQDFFRRMMAQGHTFVWCNKAVAYETVPPGRWKRTFMLKRALLRGRNSLKHPSGRARLIAKSLIAVPLYGLTLPVASVAGHHKFMKVLIKLCDHFGRVLTLLRINPVREREM